MISHSPRPNTTLTIWSEILSFRPQCSVMPSTWCIKPPRTTSMCSKRTRIRMLTHGSQRSTLISIHRFNKLSIGSRVISVPPIVSSPKSHNSTYLYLKRLRKLKPRRMPSKQAPWTCSKSSKNAQQLARRGQHRSVLDIKRLNNWCMLNQPQPTIGLNQKLNWTAIT